MVNISARLMGQCLHDGIPCAGPPRRGKVFRQWAVQRPRTKNTAGQGFAQGYTLFAYALTRKPHDSRLWGGCPPRPRHSRNSIENCLACR